MSTVIKAFLNLFLRIDLSAKWSHNICWKPFKICIEFQLKNWMCKLFSTLFTNLTKMIAKEFLKGVNEHNHPFPKKGTPKPQKIKQQMSNANKMLIVKTVWVNSNWLVVSFLHSAHCLQWGKTQQDITAERSRHWRHELPLKVGLQVRLNQGVVGSLYKELVLDSLPCLTSQELLFSIPRR